MRTIQFTLTEQQADDFEVITKQMNTLGITPKNFFLRAIELEFLKLVELEKQRVAAVAAGNKGKV